MSGEPTPRQVLYALVSAAFLLVVLVLTVGAAAAGLTPTWWTFTVLVALVIAAAWTAVSWRRTGPILIVSIGLLVIWAVGTLIVA